MKIIQKYLAGYGISPVMYTPIQRTVIAGDTGSKSYDKQLDAKEDVDGFQNKLFSESMIKALSENALPSDMLEFLKMSTLFTKLNFWDNTGNTAQLTSEIMLYYAKLKSLKELFEKGMEVVKNAEAASEIAISPYGLVYVTDLDGKNLRPIDPRQFNREKLRGVTNYELAARRVNSPSMAFNNDVTMTFGNATSMKKITDLIKSQVNVGTTSESREGYANPFRADNNLLEFLKSLNITADDLRGATLDTIYKIKKVTKTLADRILAIVDGIATGLDKSMLALLQVRAKELGVKDIKALLVEYVSKYLNGEKSISLDIVSTMDPSGKETKSEGSTKDISMKLTPPMEAALGIGERTSFEIVNGGLDAIRVVGIKKPLTNGKNEPLGLYKNMQELSEGGYSGILDFLNMSMGGNMISNTMGIYVINTDSNADFVELPIDRMARSRGIIRPDLKMANIIGSILRAIRGLNPKNAEDLKKIQLVCALNGLPSLYKDDGTLNEIDYARFAVFTGLARDTAFDKDVNESLGLGDSSLSNSIEEVDSEEREEFKNIMKEYQKGYKQSNGFPIFGGGTKIYKGSIYIPVSSNVISAANSSDMNLSSNESMQILADELALDRQRNNPPTIHKSVNTTK